ncbi:MAG: hypothetical protein ABSD59_09360 [Terracidiphilus sp.]|jgi:hypothetical protein
MKNRNQMELWVLSAAVVLVLAGAPPVSAQAGAPAALSAVQAHRQAQTESAQPLSDQDVAATQDQLLKLLKLSPILTSVVARDPSLLSDRDYVARNNPELAQFIVSHPDIEKNPEFYLFSHLNYEGGKHRDQALERAVWPDLVPLPQEYRQPNTSKVIESLIPILVPLGFFAVVGWIIYLVVQSRRWNRSFQQQSELYGRLIDKFGSSQELAAYMQTEAGQRFLAISPSSMSDDSGIRMPNAVSRVLTSLSVGIVLALLGVGFLLLRNAGPDTPEPMLVTGTLLLMPGLGFILSAGATWVLAHRLGLMPEKEIAETKASGPYGSQGRQ